MERSRLTADRILKEYCTLQISRIKESNDSVGIELLYEDVAHMEEFRLLREMAVDGKSHLEMAQSRGISVEACRKRVQRAKETLRNKLQI
jgi:RNA polymerase sigma-70 factor (ECF subfamily)